MCCLYPILNWNCHVLFINNVLTRKHTTTVECNYCSEQCYFQDISTSEATSKKDKKKKKGLRTPSFLKRKKDKKKDKKEEASK